MRQTWSRRSRQVGGRKFEQSIDPKFGFRIRSHDDQVNRILNLILDRTDGGRLLVMHQR